MENVIVINEVDEVINTSVWVEFSEEQLKKELLHLIKKLAPNLKPDVMTDFDHEEEMEKKYPSSESE